LFLFLLFYNVKAFGGALHDVIRGNDGEDIILGDFGLYNAQTPYVPTVHYSAKVDTPQFAGPDEIYGGNGDDFLMGQEVRRI